MTQITTRQALQTLKDIVRDKIRVESSGWTYSGLSVLASLDRSIFISFFVDAGELDYINDIIIGNRARAVSDDLQDDGDDFLDVLDHLTLDERERLIQIIQFQENHEILNEYMQKDRPIFM